ncbi:MAG: 1-acyl-sn-glycerol-3-phosphate acyltransferase [Bacteroidota bacterium]
MLLYAAVRPLAKLGLRYYFQHLDLSNTERIPENAAVILAANHPTTFIEPCVLACYLPQQFQQLRFLARGDFFRFGWAARLLSSVNIIPVYRLRDAGYSGLKNNFQSFERSYEQLQNGRTIMILAEGRSIHEKRLRPVRKGTARIAIGALQNTELEEVYVIPVGVNYTYADRIQSDVLINCGEPIKASAFLRANSDNINVAINEMTRELKRRLANEVIHINKIEDEALVENIHRLYRTEKVAVQRDFLANDGRQLRAEHDIAKAVNKLNAEDKLQLNALSHDYFSRLEKMRIDDYAFRGKYRPYQKKTAQVFLGFLPALLLLIWHLPAMIFSQWFAGVVMKTLEFAHSVKWAALIGFYPLYVLAWLVLALVLGSWWPVALVTVQLLSTRFLINYVTMTKRWFLAYRARRQAEHELKYMRQQRKELLEKVRGFWGATIPAAAPAATDEPS